MTRLKLAPLADEKPVRVSLELSASLYRQLSAYAAALAQESGQPINEPTKLIAPMLERFMATDRAFTKARRDATTSSS
jgi:hypothetical protein